MSSYKSDDLISWETKSRLSDIMDSPNIPVLDFNTPEDYYRIGDNYLEEFDMKAPKKKHRHYYLYQKRFNKIILDINHMSLFDKIKLKYIS